MPLFVHWKNISRSNW